MRNTSWHPSLTCEGPDWDLPSAVPPRAAGDWEGGCGQQLRQGPLHHRQGDRRPGTRQVGSQLRQGCVLRCIKVVCYAASMFCAPLQHQGCVLHYIKVMCSAASRLCAPLHQGCVHLGCVLRWETFNDNGKFSLWPFYMKGKNYLHLLSTLEVTTAFKIK